MADAQDSGTPPQAAVTDPAQGGGTTSDGQDGREPTAKPVDAALALAWKEKAERYNALEAEREDLRRRLEEAERRSHGQQQQQDPRVQQLAELQQRAVYDPDAQRELSLWHMQAQALAENQLTQALYAEAVPPKLAGRVADIVRQSGYRTTVAEALAMVAPAENPEVASKLKSMQEELEKARRELAEARKRQPSGPGWAGGGGGGSVGHGGAPTMTASEYAAALAEGGKRAADVRADMAANRLRLVPG